MMNLPPLCTALPYPEDSTTLFEKIHQLSWPVLLDSANTHLSFGRYDIFSADPFIALTLKDNGETHIATAEGEVSIHNEDPFLLLDNTLKPFQQNKTDLPFAGGAIGYFSYDLGRQIETLENLTKPSEQVPDMAIGIYDWAVVVDHKLKQCWLASYGVDSNTADRWDELVTLFTQTYPSEKTKPFIITGELSHNLNKPDYLQRFNAIQRYITEGDCYQVNLSMRFEVPAEGNCWFAYQQLRQLNPAPFSAYFNIDDVCIMSSSPERFLSVKQSQVETKPIKGTRPRDLNDPEHDRALAKALEQSTKDRAENLMIVDLLRNDMGKVCQPGSIQVPHPFELESYATVHHLVSTITGELEEQHSAVSLLRACFPGGSITGAPKVRAMEIIEELEPHRRSIYCGSMAYIGFDGNMDSNITIRTLIYNQNRLHFCVGGGIVSGSNGDDEYQEALDKAAALIQLITELPHQ